MFSNAEENFRHFSRQIKVQEEGCKGETGTVRASPANKKLFPTTRHRRLAGRDPTLPQSRDWSPERRNLHNIKPVRRPALPGLILTFAYFVCFVDKVYSVAFI